MHARPYVYATFGRWAPQAALPKCNIRALKVNTFSFLDIQSQLLFTNILDVAMFKQVFYKINEKKFNDKVNSNLDSIHGSTQFTISTEMKQPQ